MKIIKVWANIGPGHQSYDETYVFVGDDTTDKSIEDIAEGWCEDTYHYTNYIVHWEEVEAVDANWRDLERESLQRQRGRIMEALEELEEVPAKYMLPHRYKVGGYWGAEKPCSKCVWYSSGLCEKWLADCDENGHCSRWSPKEPQ